ncbi:MAG: hypothetical protein HRT90_11240, partial [Candidatus Margulisbacteria bacterium]|nr:hypothetical protein [Candidatus Margulisiibacteriota bacterium]
MYKIVAVVCEKDVIEEKKGIWQYVLQGMADLFCFNISYPAFGGKKLPEDLHLHYLSFLDLKDILRASSVSKHYNRIIPEAGTRSIQSKFEKLGINVEKGCRLGFYQNTMKKVKEFREKEGYQKISINEVVKRTETNERMLHSAMRYPFAFNNTEGLYAATGLMLLGADPRIKTTEGQTALHIACIKHVPPAIISTLLSGGADVNATNVFEQTPLHKLTALFHPAESVCSVITLLITNKANIDAQDRFGEAALHNA